MENDSIFEVIGSARETLSEMNLKPEGECSICLNKFGDIKKLHKLDCYHLYHKSCVFRYLSETLTKIRVENAPLPASHKIPEILHCPVCRHPLAIPFDQILHFKCSNSNADENSETSELSDHFCKLAIERQKKFKNKFFRQKRSGAHWTEETNCLHVRDGNVENQNVENPNVQNVENSENSNCSNPPPPRRNYRYRYRKRRDQVQN